MASVAERAQLRSFGLLVGGIVGAIALWPLVRGHDIRWWGVALAIALIGPAIVAPRILRPAHRAWMALGNVLGWVNTHVILAVIFYGLVTPIGIVLRLTGRDPMRRRLEPSATTYRVPVTPRPGSHMTRQF